MFIRSTEVDEEVPSAFQLVISAARGRVRAIRHKTDGCRRCVASVLNIWSGSSVLSAGVGSGAGRKRFSAASVSGASAVVILVFGEACGGGVRCACHLFVLVRTCCPAIVAGACRSLSMAFCESEQLMCQGLIIRASSLGCTRP